MAFLASGYIYAIAPDGLAMASNETERITSETALTPERQIEVTLSSSKPQMVAGSAFGINAQIKNLSRTIVYIIPRYVTLSAPPEIAGLTVNFWAIIMAPGHKNAGKEEFQYDRIVEIAPGDRMTAYFVSRSMKCPTFLATFFRPTVRDDSDSDDSDLTLE
jgi:hypothetical protein